MNFCHNCGSPLKLEVPESDNRCRGVCTSCNQVHYENPKVIVAVCLYHSNSLLWVRHSAGLYKGFWGFPRGFLENGETVQQAAARELYEETLIKVDPISMIPISISSILATDELYIAFRCRCDAEIAAERTPETEDWGWYTEDEAPWDQLAHPEIETPLRQVYEWILKDSFALRVGSVAKSGGDYAYFPLA